MFAIRIYLPFSGSPQCQYTISIYSLVGRGPTTAPHSLSYTYICIHTRMSPPRSSAIYFYVYNRIEGRIDSHRTTYRQQEKKGDKINGIFECSCSGFVITNTRTAFPLKTSIMHIHLVFGVLLPHTRSVHGGHCTQKKNIKKWTNIPPHTM